MPTASYIVTCPSCGSGNRIPADKEALQGRCGSCKASLPPLYFRPQQLDERSFDSFIRTYPGAVLAEFWAPWCPHCVSYEPVVRKVAEQLAGRAAVVQVNTRDNPSLASRFGVRGIPVIMLLKGGRVVDQLTGVQPVETILSWYRRQG